MRVRDIIGTSQIKKIKEKLESQELEDFSCVNDILDYVADDEYVKLDGLIEIVLPCTTPDIFTVKKTYTIVEAVDDTYGKWPNQLGNGWFTDSQFLIDDLIDMIVDTVPDKLENKDRGSELVNAMRELGDLFKAKDYGRNIDQYAMQVGGKYMERDNEYVKYAADSTVGRGKLRLMEVLGDFIAHLQSHDNVKKIAPFLEALEKMEGADFQVGSVLLTIVIFLFILDFIVIYTIMLSDVDERTYDFAMLRCLGFKNSSLVLLLLM